MVSTLYICFKSESDCFENDYYKYYFDSDLPNFQLSKITQVGARAHGLLNVGKNDFMSIKIPFPPLPEQKAIANILSALDEKIEINNKINKNLEEMAQAIFKRWFVDFEFPNEDGKPFKSSGGEMVQSELGLIPKGWEVKLLKDCIDVIDNRGKTPPNNNKRTRRGLKSVKYNFIKVL